MTEEKENIKFTSWQKTLSEAREALRLVADLQEVYIYKSTKTGKYLVTHLRVPSSGWTLVKIERREGAL